MELLMKKGKDNLAPYPFEKLMSNTSAFKMS